MNEYLGTSFIVPTVLAYVAAFAWVIVARRMRNLEFPTWKILLTILWAMALISIGVMDVLRRHQFDSEWRAIAVVFSKTVVRIGLVVLAVVRYREIAKLHPVRMAMCPVEPTPEGHEMIGTEAKTVAAAAELMNAAETAMNAAESVVSKIDDIQNPDRGSLRAAQS